MAIFRNISLLTLITSLFVISSANAMTNERLDMWQKRYLNNMSLEELQLTANFLYLSYAIALVELKIKQFSTPIARLNQSIRANIAEYKSASDDIEMLKTLLDRLSYVTGARTIYIDTLNTLVKYHNEHNNRFINVALEAIQLDAQTTLRTWANEQTDATAQQFQLSSSRINENVQYFQNVSGLHKNMSEGIMPMEITQENEHSKALIMFDIIINSSPVLMTMAENIIHTLNETSDHAAQIIAVGAEVYKQYYATIYKVITLPTFDKQYATTLFGMHDLLPEEYKSLLPAPDQVFTHMLQTTKLYTQTELLPQ